MNHKQSTMDALLRSQQRSLDADKPKESTGRKNGQPEELVCNELAKYWRKNQFDMDRYESSTFIRGNEFSDKITVKRGHPDYAGNDRFGFAIYCEVKATGKRYNASETQFLYLLNKINKGSFACVSDSESHFHELYHRWLVLKLRQREMVVLRPLNKEDFAQGAGCPKKLLIDDLPDKFKKEHLNDNGRIF